jgi:hypothetical protein
MEGTVENTKPRLQSGRGRKITAHMKWPENDRNNEIIFRLLDHVIIFFFAICKWRNKFICLLDSFWNLRSLESIGVLYSNLLLHFLKSKWYLQFLMSTDWESLVLYLWVPFMILLWWQLIYFWLQQWQQHFICLLASLYLPPNLHGTLLPN